MCGKSMNMIKVCRKMPSEVRLEKIGVHQLMKGQFTMKYLIFREIWKIPCVVQIFPVLYLNSLCFPLSGKSDNQIPCFQRAVATLIPFISKFTDVKKNNISAEAFVYCVYLVQHMTICILLAQKM